MATLDYTWNLNRTPNIPIVHANILNKEKAIAIAENFSKRKAKSYVEGPTFFIIGVGGYDGLIGIYKKDSRPFTLSIATGPKEMLSALHLMKDVNL